MIRLNLLPDVQREFREVDQIQHKLFRATQMAMGITVSLAALLALWVYGVQAVHEKLLDDSITKRYEQLRSVKDIDTYATLQNQLRALRPLHEDKNLTSRLLDYLPSLNSGVTINKITLSADGRRLTFEGEALDYRRLVIFRDTLRGASLLYRTAGSQKQSEVPFVTSVRLDKSETRMRNTLSYVSFKISTNYHEVAFKRAAVQPALVIGEEETTPSVLAEPLVTGGQP